MKYLAVLFSLLLLVSAHEAAEHQQDLSCGAGGELSPLSPLFQNAQWIALAGFLIFARGLHHFVKNNKKRMAKWLIAGFVVLAAGVYMSEAEGPMGSTHIHADLLVYINGQQQNYNGDEWMERNHMAHLHDNNGGIVHVHATNVRWSRFLQSMELQPDARAFDNFGDVQQFWNSKILDGQRVVIYYGPQPSAAALDGVSTESCIYDGTCPERGTTLATCS